MTRTWWASRPLRVKGLLVALLPGVPIVVLWILVGVAVLRSDGAAQGPAARTREVTAMTREIARALADARVAAYVQRVPPQGDVRWVEDAGALRSRVADEEGLRVLDAFVESLSRHQAALGAVAEATAGQAAVDAESAAYRAVAAAQQALIRQRELWMASELARSQSRSRWILGAFFGGSVLAVAGGLWLSVGLMRSITMRVERVVAGADALTQGRPVDLTGIGHDEIGTLAKRLMDILQLLHARESELAARNSELAAVNQELEAFSYSVSHDLRAPLRAIAGFSQIVEEDAADKLDEKSLGALRRVRRATARMSVLIDQLLNLSRLSRVPLHIERVDLSALANEVIAHLRESDPGRQVAVEIQPGLTIDGDPGLMKIALENLLGNAWKYTARTPHPRITVSASPEGGDTVFSISDNGAGFDMAHARMLFGAFQRLHPQKEFDGTGIGLATVQRLIHRHGGRVSATGTVGQGATFSFVIPARGHAT
jgi:signal transduction histidine kinase